MTPETRQIYRERIADPATPEGLRKYYTKLMREPDTVIPERGKEPPAFLHFLKHLSHDQTTPDTDHPTHPPLEK